MEASVAKTYTGKGGHRTYFLDGGRWGGHRTYFVDEGTDGVGVGTPHNK